MVRWKPRSTCHPPLMSDILALVSASSLVSLAMTASLDRSVLCAAASSSLSSLRMIIANLTVHLKGSFHGACAQLPDLHLVINIHTLLFLTAFQSPRFMPAALELASSLTLTWSRLDGTAHRSHAVWHCFDTISPYGRLSLAKGPSSLSLIKKVWGPVAVSPLVFLKLSQR